MSQCIGKLDESSVQNILQVGLCTGYNIEVGTANVAVERRVRSAIRDKRLVNVVKIPRKPIFPERMSLRLAVLRKKQAYWRWL